MKTKSVSWSQWQALLQRRLGHVTTEQLLWALRMALLLLGAMACLRALLGVLAGGDGRPQLESAAALTQRDGAVEQSTLVPILSRWPEEPGGRDS